MTPNSEQQLAIDAMLAHLRATGDDPFFTFKGPAGAGKTFCTAFVANAFKRKMVFTAPTNKAVRVLREALTRDDFKPHCCTIYSLLGLQMTPNGEIKELRKRDEEVDLSDVAAVIVDEAGMVNSELLKVHITTASKMFPRIRWVFMGDPYQLPPVGEMNSPIWELPKGTEITQIMRQDNQILTLSVHLRGMVAKPFGKLQLVDDNDGEEGVWKVANLEQAILNHAESFRKGESKAIAWRNVTVDGLNAMIRKELFADPVAYPWQPGDRVTLLEPANDTTGDKKVIVGTTDEEGAIEKADVAPHPVHGEFQCWRLVVRSDLNRSMTLWVMQDTPANKRAFENRKARLSAEARANPRNWAAFWDFVESFHKVRHAYAITAHRAQGSTYQRAFVKWTDILVNPNRAESMRCLYVAATRPRKELYLG